MKPQRTRKLLTYLGTRLSWLLVLVLGKLARIDVRGRGKVEQLRRRGQRVILAVWHGRMLLPIYLHRNEGVCAMVSLHEDGEIIAQTIRRLGYRTVRGSSRRRGLEALRELVRAMTAGADGAIIPDGPRGPRHRLKPGVLLLARETGAAIVPIVFSTDRPIVFNSWDRFTIWRPFARCLVIYGGPYFIPSDWPLRRVLREGKRIERDMIELERRADAHFHQ